LAWLREREHFFTLVYPAVSPPLALLPLLAFVVRRAEVTVALHLIALPLLPGPWGFVLAPYAAVFLFTVPASVYGPYLAAAYLVAAVVYGPVNPLLIPLAAAGGWWAFWKARHLASPISIRARPPVLTAGEVGAWSVEVVGCCVQAALSSELDLVEAGGRGVCEARAVFKVGGVYRPVVKVVLSDPLGVVKTVRAVEHPEVVVVPRAKAALEAYGARGVEPTEFEGLREYVPGDSPRRIHWRKSLALERLVVKVFSTAGRFAGVVLVPFARDAEAADRLAEAAIYSALLAGAPVYLYDFREVKRVEDVREVVSAVKAVGNFLSRPVECLLKPQGLPRDVLVVADEPYAACFKDFEVIAL